MRCIAVVLLFIAAIVARADDPPLIAPGDHRSPEQERAAFKVPDGFEVQLVAAEPDIAKPINMAFDAKGRLWVTCSVEYPYPAKDGQGRDSVKILSDFGPDGRARKIETFADGLNIPIGVLPYKDGAIVYSIPNLWRLRDTKGTGKCDTREVLYSGFGHKDTHGMVNGLLMGFDGWVYACHGYANDSKVKGTDGHEIEMNSGNVFRFKPDGSRVELFAKGQVNPFGSCMDKWGNLFTACCHSKPITMVLRGGVYESFSKPHDGLGFAPAMVHQYRGSTALCGLAWYEANYFPEPYRESFYLGDVINNCINRFTVTWNGATPTAHQQDDFLKSSDPWFRPCDIKLGPDGALYVADFYNRIIGHYEVPLNHPGRDRVSGRIWRIVRKDTPTAISDRTKSSVKDLVRDLDSSDICVRFLATNELVDRGPDIVAVIHTHMSLKAFAASCSHALWILERLEKEPSNRLRYWSFDNSSRLANFHRLRIGSERIGVRGINLSEAVNTISLNDPIHRRGIVEWESRHGNRPSYTTMILKELDGSDDPILRHTCRMALRDSLLTFGLPNDRTSRDLWDQLFDVAVGAHATNGGEMLRLHVTKYGKPLSMEQAKHCARYAKWDDQGLEEVLQKLELLHFRDLTTLSNLAVAWTQGWELRGQPMPAAASEWCQKIGVQALESPDPPGLKRGVDVATSTRNPELLKRVANIVTDRKRHPEARIVGMPAIATSHTTALCECLSSTAEPSIVREAAAKALGPVNRPEARAALIESLPTAPARLATIIASGLADSKTGAEQLCTAVEKGQASAQLLADRGVRAKLNAHGLKERVDKLTEGLLPSDKQTEALIAKRREAYLKAKPDLEHGKQLFTKHCAICHQVGGLGSKIGPQLDGIGVRGLDRLLEDTLDPNRNVDPTFRSTTLNLADGRSLNGLVLREEGQVVVLADDKGKETSVPRNDIERRGTSPLSAMPTLAADAMSEAEFMHLMGYLLSLRK